MKRTFKKLTAEQRERIKELINQGIKFAAIAFEYNVHDSTIQYLAKQIGHRRRYRTRTDREQIQQRINQGMDYTSIAKELNLSRGHVGQVARELGIYIGQGRGGTHQSAARYGKVVTQREKACQSVEGTQKF